MSVRVLTWVFEASKSSGADRLVLLAIADATDDNGRNAYPSTATIARKANINNRSVQRALNALIELGELKVKKNAGPSGTNRYQVMMPRGWQRATPPGNTPPGDTPPPWQDATPGEMPEGRQDAIRQDAIRSDAGGVAPRHRGGGEVPPEPSFNQLPTTTAVGSRNAPAGFAPRIVRAYVVACRDAGVPAPEESQARVERSARSLLAQGYAAADIEDAARNAAAQGWTDLATQLQRDASRASPATNGRASTADQRFQAGLDLAAQLERKALP